MSQLNADDKKDNHIKDDHEEIITFNVRPDGTLYVDENFKVGPSRVKRISALKFRWAK